MKVTLGGGMDDTRFEAAWSAYAPAVLRYCTYSTGSQHTGEDIAAETFARFFATGDRIPQEHTEAWLIAVARNLCISHHRTNRRRELLAAALGHRLTEAIDTGGKADSWEYVRRLTETQRLIVYLRLAEDRPFAEIARLTNRSEGATKMTFYRAIDRLRHEMGFDDAAPIGGVEHAPAE